MVIELVHQLCSKSLGRMGCNDTKQGYVMNGDMLLQTYETVRTHFSRGIQECTSQCVQALVCSCGHLSVPVRTDKTTGLTRGSHTCFLLCEKSDKCALS